MVVNNELIFFRKFSDPASGRGHEPRWTESKCWDDINWEFQQASLLQAEGCPGPRRHLGKHWTLWGGQQQRTHHEHKNVRDKKLKQWIEEKNSQKKSSRVEVEISKDWRRHIRTEAPPIQLMKEEKQSDSMGCLLMNILKDWICLFNIFLRYYIFEN